MKKNRRNRQKSAAFDIVLTIFLAVFVLLSIGLGLLAWANRSAEQAVKKKFDEHKRTTNAKLAASEFNEFIALEAINAVGAALGKAKDADAKDQGIWVEARKNILKGDSFSTMTLAPAVKKWIAQNDKNLVFLAGEKRFKTKYMDRIQELAKQLADKSIALKAAEDKNKAILADYNSYKKDYENWKADLASKIDKNNTAALTAINAKSEGFDKLRKLKEKAELEKIKSDAKYEEIIQKRDQVIFEQKEALKSAWDALKAKADKKNGKGGDESFGFGRPHALVLDVSTGRPLWDRARGKITKVVRGTNRVFLNLGSADGVKPQLTFNVFPAGSDGKALGFLKGSVEVQQVLGKHSSIARIISAFGADGREISLNDDRKGVIGKLADNPIRQGDLLYNLFWKTRAAVAGKFNLDGSPVFSKAQEWRNMERFMALLQKQGIKIDAWLDPRDNTINGAITKDTGYLILGTIAFTSNKFAKESELDVMKVFNVKREKLRAEAEKKGMLIVKGHLFSYIIGYRPTRSANSTQVGRMRARLPFAGLVLDYLPKKQKKSSAQSAGY